MAKAHTLVDNFNDDSTNTSLWTVGDQPTPATGVGTELAQIRAYRPGDDVRRMAALGVRASVQPAHLIDDRDGQPYFYDVNALSNFVADAPSVVGFDPWPRLVDYLESRRAGA